MIKRLPKAQSIMATAAAALIFILFAILFAPTQYAAAAESYCPNRAHAVPAKVPADLLPAVAKAFQIDPGVVGEGAVVRCVGAKLMACVVGANLDCGKANTRRVLRGATAWCRQHPGAANIPMAATGHATIYQWSCRRRRAVAGKALVAVDRQGYIADNWKAVP
ncbi:MAG TPA: hypothetical protein VL048_05270 [Xanthobacteraceae bacterium]|nr:hypothetical protein [Xanthobacteraceae bacterium]